MKAIVGLVLVVCGIALGLYAGVWWAFIGGIVDVITEIRAPELSALGIAIGVAKVLFAGLIGWLSALVLILPGVAFIQAS
jgi:hypothetical protein